MTDADGDNRRHYLDVVNNINFSLKTAHSSSSSLSIRLLPTSSDCVIFFVLIFNYFFSFEIVVRLPIVEVLFHYLIPVWYKYFIALFFFLIPITCMVFIVLDKRRNRQSTSEFDFYLFLFWYRFQFLPPTYRTSSSVSVVGKRYRTHLSKLPMRTSQILTIFLLLSFLSKFAFTWKGKSTDWKFVEIEYLF